MAEQEKTETMLGVYRVLDLTDEKGFYCGHLLGIPEEEFAQLMADGVFE